MRVLALSLLIFSGIGTSAFAQSDTSDLSGEEVKFYRMVNQFRQMLHVPTLNIQEGLQTAARGHSVWMQAQDIANGKDSLMHNGPSADITPFQRMKQQGYGDYTYAGENISCGNGTALKTFQQFVFSPSHLVNLINPHFHDTGIAREGTGDEDCHYYWTHDFGSLTPGKNDPEAVTDLSLITQAVIAVSGPLPRGKIVALPPAETDSDSGPMPGRAPLPRGNSQTSGLQQAFNQLNTGGTSVSSQIAPITSLQCVVPFALGRGLVTPYTNTDTLLQAVKSSDNTYSVTTSYFSNKVLASVSPIVTDAVTITQNPDYPVVTLFVAPGSKLGGFMIQVNTQTNQAQFDSYGISPGMTGAVTCTVSMPEAKNEKSFLLKNL